MNVKIWATQDKERLKENLERRVEKVQTEDDHLAAETDEPEKLGKVPGVEHFETGENRFDGLGGKPVKKEAYAVIESRRDAVKAFLATVEGYDLRVIDTDREWDLRKLRKYNPDIKQLNKASEELEIEYSLTERSFTEKVEIEMPEDEKVDRIYREFLA